MKNGFEKTPLTTIIAVFGLAISILSLILSTWTYSDSRQFQQHIQPTLKYRMETYNNGTQYFLANDIEAGYPLIHFSIRNDGRTSTGQVLLISPSDSKFRFYITRNASAGIEQGAYWDNIPPETGNTTNLKIYYSPCHLLSTNCTIDDVPYGTQRVPVIIRCSLCNDEEKEIKTYFEIYIESS